MLERVTHLVHRRLHTVRPSGFSTAGVAALAVARDCGTGSLRHPALLPVLVDQAGVVSRRQAQEAGVRPHELARLLRRRELVALRDGVYVDHTGQPTFLQRAWAATLCYEPAALAGPTALRVVEGPGSRRPEQPIHLAVERNRRHRAAEGIVLHRTAHLQQRVLWHVGPPRLRYEEAALDVAAAAATELDAVGELSRVVQSRRTTAARLSETLRARPRVRRRRWLESVLDDVANGTCSVLEHGYLHRVERAHGLTRARRQVRDRLGQGVVFRDVLYEGGTSWSWTAGSSTTRPRNETATSTGTSTPRQAVCGRCGCHGVRCSTVRAGRRSGSCRCSSAPAPGSPAGPADLPARSEPPPDPTVTACVEPVTHLVHHRLHTRAGRSRA